MKLGLFLAAVALFLAVAPRLPATGEQAARLATARAIVERHTIDLAGDRDQAGDDAPRAALDPPPSSTLGARATIAPSNENAAPPPAPGAIGPAKKTVAPTTSTPGAIAPAKKSAAPGAIDTTKKDVAAPPSAGKKNWPSFANPIGARPGAGPRGAPGARAPGAGDPARRSAAPVAGAPAAEPIDPAARFAWPSTIVHDGRRFATAAPGGALALVPAEAAARLARVGGVGRGLVESASAALAAALVCVLLFAGARRLGASAGAALAAAALAALGTSLFIYARVPDGSALAALLLLAAVQAARATSGPRPLGAALLTGAAAGALTTLDLGYFLPALVVVLGAAARQGAGRRVSLVGAAALAPLLGGAALALAHRHAIGWEPLPGDLAEGLIGLVGSTGKSVFAYSPPLVLAPLALGAWWRRARADCALTLAVSLALLVGVARLHDWHGDPAWGPRRLLPLVPLFCEPIALWLDGARLRRRAALALGALGLLVQLAGAAYPPSQFLRLVGLVRNATGAPAWFAEAPSECHFVPQFSPLVGQPWLMRHALGKDRDGAADAPWRILVPQTPKLDAEWPRLRFDWWALDVPRARAAAGLAALGALGLFGATLGFQAARRRRRQKA